MDIEYQQPEEELDQYLVYELDNIKLLLVKKNGETEVIVEKGTLQLIQYGDVQLIIKINDFEYQLFQETPVYLTAYQSYRSYILPSLEGNYGILIENDVKKHMINVQNNQNNSQNNNVDADEDLYDCFDAILQSTSNLIYNQSNKEEGIQSIRKSQIMLKNSISQNTPGGNNEIPKGIGYQNQEDTPSGEEVEKINKQLTLNQSNKNSQSDQSNNSNQSKDNQFKRENSLAKYIGIGGSYISKGISYSADVLHSGIKETGNFIEKHVTKKNEIQISDSTKGAFKFISNLSGQIIKFTSYAASAIIDTSIKIGSMAVGAIIGKDSSKSKNKSLKYLREVAGASVQASGEILLSLDSAADKIGKQIGETATTVVQKKFGDDAAEIVSDGTNTILNVKNVYGNVKSLAIKKILTKTAKESIKQNI